MALCLTPVADGLMGVCGLDKNKPHDIHVPATAKQIIAEIMTARNALDRLHTIFDQVASVSFCHQCQPLFDRANVEPADYNQDDTE